MHLRAPESRWSGKIRGWRGTEGLRTVPEPTAPRTVAFRTVLEDTVRRTVGFGTVRKATVRGTWVFCTVQKTTVRSPSRIVSPDRLSCSW